MTETRGRQLRKQSVRDVPALKNQGTPPTNSAESAMIATLQPGSYTAIVRGVNNTTGNALVEVYALP